MHTLWPPLKFNATNLLLHVPWDLNLFLSHFLRLLRPHLNSEIISSETQIKEAPSSGESLETGPFHFINVMPYRHPLIIPAFCQYLNASVFLQFRSTWRQHLDSPIFHMVKILDSWIKLSISFVNADPKPSWVKCPKSPLSEINPRGKVPWLKLWVG